MLWFSLYIFLLFGPIYLFFLAGGLLYMFPTISASLTALSLNSGYARADVSVIGSDCSPDTCTRSSSVLLLFCLPFDLS